MGRLKRGCKYDGWIREFIGYHQERDKKVIGLGEWMFSDIVVRVRKDFDAAWSLPKLQKM